MHHSPPAPKRVPLDDRRGLHPNAAGLDIGARAIVVAVPAERDATPVRVFATFMPDLQALVEWLIQCGIDTTAMASTGVSWVPIVEMLEPRGITPSLVHTQQVKTVPGRKSDWNDAQWLQKRQTLGWLQGAFRPNAERCVWRSRMLNVVTRATYAFRQAAQSVARSGSSFGASCRAMRARLGPQQAPSPPRTRWLASSIIC